MAGSRRLSPGGRRPPRIGVDARAVAAEQKTGVERYAAEVATRIPAAAERERFFLFVDRAASREDVASLRGPRARVVRVPVAHPRLYEAALRLLARVLRLDLMHLPIGAAPARFPCPVVMNLHDLTFEVHPEFYDPVDLVHQRQALASAAHAAAVIAISESTRRDAVALGGVAPEKVHVTLLEPRADLADAAEGPPRVRGRYALCVGIVQPRKNHLAVVRALPLVADRDLQVVLAGKVQDDAYRRRVLDEAQRLGVADRLHLLGYVPDGELARLFDDAQLLLFPSLYEGFGYPVVEAFARGVPVVTSEVSCLPEIAGDAAELCDPADPASIAAAVDRVLASPARAAQLVERGRRRLEELRRVPLPERTLAVYRAVLAA